MDTTSNDTTAPGTTPPDATVAARPAPEASTTRPPPRRLARNRGDGLVGGVASGLAEYLGINPVIVRLGFVVTALFGGMGVIAYVLGWIALPVSARSTDDRSSRGDRAQLFGYALVALGLVVIGDTGWDVPMGGLFWPITLIGLGAAVLYLRARDSGDFDASPDALDVGPHDGPDDPPGRGPDDPTDAPPASPSPTLALKAPPEARAPWPRGRVRIAEHDPDRDARRDARRRERQARRLARVDERDRLRPKSGLGAATVSALLILFGGAWLLDAIGALDADVGVVLALALVIVGGALVVSAWWGRSRALMFVGIPLVLAVSAFGIIDVPLEGGIGGATYRPRTVALVDRSYELAIGNLTVDLSKVDFAGSRRRVHAQLGIGQLNVTVPRDVRVIVDGHVGAGSVNAFDDPESDCCPADVRVVRPGAAGAGTVLIDAEVGAGNIHIIREGATDGPS